MALFQTSSLFTVTVQARPKSYSIIQMYVSITIVKIPHYLQVIL